MNNSLSHTSPVLGNVGFAYPHNRGAATSF
jgi:hypothetical protein